MRNITTYFQPKEKKIQSYGEEIKCAICLVDVTDKATLSSCRHVFCFACIHTWSKISNTCPSCRVRFSQIHHHMDVHQSGSISSMKRRTRTGQRGIEVLNVENREQSVPEHYQNDLDWANSSSSRPCLRCGSDEAPESTLLCDMCDMPFHTYCLSPRIHDIPEGDWYCPRCVASDGNDNDQDWKENNGYDYNDGFVVPDEAPIYDSDDEYVPGDSQFSPLSQFSPPRRRAQSQIRANRLEIGGRGAQRSSRPGRPRGGGRIIPNGSWVSTRGSKTQHQRLSPSQKTPPNPNNDEDSESENSFVDLTTLHRQSNTTVCTSHSKNIGEDRNSISPPKTIGKKRNLRSTSPSPSRSLTNHSSLIISQSPVSTLKRLRRMNSIPISSSSTSTRSSKVLSAAPAMTGNSTNNNSNKIRSRRTGICTKTSRSNNMPITSPYFSQLSQQSSSQKGAQCNSSSNSNNSNSGGQFPSPSRSDARSPPRLIVPPSLSVIKRPVSPSSPTPPPTTLPLPSATFASHSSTLSNTTTAPTLSSCGRAPTRSSLPITNSLAPDLNNKAETKPISRAIKVGQFLDQFRFGRSEEANKGKSNIVSGPNDVHSKKPAPSSPALISSPTPVSPISSSFSSPTASSTFVIPQTQPRQLRSLSPCFSSSSSSSFPSLSGATFVPESPPRSLLSIKSAEDLKSERVDSKKRKRANLKSTLRNEFNMKL